MIEWSDKTPTKAGWYWLRYQADGHSEIRQVVAKTYKGIVAQTGIEHSQDGFVPCSQWGAQFWAEIPEPVWKGCLTL